MSGRSDGSRVVVLGPSLAAVAASLALRGRGVEVVQIDDPGDVVLESFGHDDIDVSPMALKDGPSKRKGKGRHKQKPWMK